MNKTVKTGPQNISQEFMTVGEVARELDVNKSLIHYYIKSGLLAPVGNVGKAFVFHRAAVLKQIKWIQQGRKRGATLKAIAESMPR